MRECGAGGRSAGAIGSRGGGTCGKIEGDGAHGVGCGPGSCWRRDYSLGGA